MKEDVLVNLERKIGPNKTYLKNGYYRIRSMASNQKELAFLKPDGCGSTSVNPQITIEKINDIWVAVKLIDMGSAPTKFLTRDNETSDELDTALVMLIKKMEQAIE